VNFAAFAQDVQKDRFFMKIDLFKSINRLKIDRVKNLENRLCKNRLMDVFHLLCFHLL